jgi:presenilin-like A22 family membrane protease
VPFSTVCSFILYKNVKAVKEANPAAREDTSEVKKGILTMAVLLAAFVGLFAFALTRPKKERENGKRLLTLPSYRQLTLSPYAQDGFGDLLR